MSCHPTLCGMIAEVDGERVAVRGDPDNPDSRGFLCVRGRASAEVIGNPERLLHPLVRDRRSDDFRRASWDEALDRVAAAMRRAGRERVGLWAGHGLSATDYGVRISKQYLQRFANLHGCQTWSGSIICWGLGAFGLGLTGALEANTKEDMGEHAEQILLWGANHASQPNTTRHVVAAQRRGARVVAIDVRRSEAAERADEAVLVRPGSDAALALAMMHVLVDEDRLDPAFIEAHTIGFDALAQHLRTYTPAWAAEHTGVAAERIAALARTYAAIRPSMILIGGSSLHKGANSWLAARAISCLPALTGNLGIPGGGLGPRHGAASHGQALASITAADRRPPGSYIPNQMSAMLEAFEGGEIGALLLLGTNMLTSFADSERLARGLDRMDLVVSYDLFMNDTARRFADVVLPSTAWLEQLGCKSTNTHLYLMEPLLAPPGETRTVAWLLQQLAERLDVHDYFPWQSEEAAIDAILDHPSTGHATVASLRAADGMSALRVSPIAHPEHHYATPSGKVELLSPVAQELGLPALPVHELPADAPAEPLVLTQGRTLAHFHSFYDQGRALPSLARLEPGPILWIAPSDAAARGVADGAPIRIHNGRGTMDAHARVTDAMPPGTVWMRDGWTELNRLTSSDPVLPDAAVDALSFSAGQSRFDAAVQVTARERSP